MHIGARSLSSAPHLLRVRQAPQKAIAPVADEVVTGESSRSNETSRFSSSPAKHSSRDRGSSSALLGRACNPRVLFQNGLFAKASRHHQRHRASVRSPTPKSFFRSFARAGVTPCRIAVASTTTAPRYTFLPRYRTDAGVTRHRHFAQQKLSRLSYPAGSFNGAPRGLRGYRALSSRPPHLPHPNALALAANSPSTSNKNP